MTAEIVWSSSPLAGADPPPPEDLLITSRFEVTAGQIPDATGNWMKVVRIGVSGTVIRDVMDNGSDARKRTIGLVWCGPPGVDNVDITGELIHSLVCGMQACRGFTGFSPDLPELPRRPAEDNIRVTNWNVQFGVQNLNENDYPMMRLDVTGYWGKDVEAAQSPEDVPMRAQGVVFLHNILQLTAELSEAGREARLTPLVVSPSLDDSKPLPSSEG